MPKTVTTIVPLSGSAGATGRGIKVAQIASPGTTVHLPPNGTTDEIEVLAAISDPAIVANVRLTLQWGGTTAVDDNIIMDLEPGVGFVLVHRGILVGDGSREVKAYAGTANVITIHGRVQRLS